MSSIAQAAFRAAHVRLSGLTGRAHVVLAGRGASALCAVLAALDCAGRGVIIPANTCYVVLWAVLRAGAVPILADVDPVSGQMTTAALDTLSVSDARAIIPTWMYGLPCDLAAIAAWGRARGLAVIADCALCLQPPDTRLADAVILSFGPGKPIDHGMGGALACDDPAMAREVSRISAGYPVWTDDRARRARQWDDLYWALHQHDADEPALAALYPALFARYGDLATYRLPPDAWRGLIGRLDQVMTWADTRLDRQRRYASRLADLPLRQPLPTATALWRWPIYVAPDQRGDLLDHLWAAGQHTITRWYPSLQPMARALAPQVMTDTPQADRLAAEVITLPLDPALPDALIDAAATAIQDFFAHESRSLTS